ncbi:MAG: type II secretion system F family protein [Candidatus Scalindua sp.]|jgi:general secretion pathway protein F|nr:type II secretion system F family protein [Candidatus Scalindua sp.]MBT5304541.1 type II secretion system F family protein [Candidatus Scalindua sp.]MBT6052204.1 type II secretion system F family protein [Candidatus Scalindua sp.]MBT6227772.1 type II secretion system F family protein [Candidatus Scalindua sp.]MBT6564795.1 type II secretion system F family protein [Candidatus Scalindua sp.]
MSTFKYRVMTRGSGVLEGKRASVSKAELLDYLKKSGHIVLKVEEIGGQKAGKLFSNRSVKKATVFFTQELGILLDSGVSLDKSLRILSDAQENIKFKGLILDILEEVKGGKSLADALSMLPDVFTTVYVNMVRAGEESGALPKVLERLGSFMERVQRIKSEITSALIYPLFLVLTGVLSVGALVLIVMPKFTKVFEEVGIALPLSTQILIKLCEVLTSYGWVLLIALPGLYYLFKSLKKKNGVQASIDRKKLGIPVLGDILWRIEISRFARTLGTLLENGVSLLTSIDISKSVLSNTFLSNKIEDVKPDIKAGKGFTAPLGEIAFFPGIAQHLLKVGEETGQLDEMLVRVSDNMDTDIEHRIKRLISLVEPALILIMGCAIGIVVISMLSAIFSINEVSF